MAGTGTALRSWNDNLEHADKERWVCIYPAYINSKRTLAQGRKIPKDKCVENPTHQEIRDVIADANLNVFVENKQYSRERSKELLYRGRIRVQLKRNDGTVLNPLFPTRESVMLYVADKIPKLKSRQTKPSEQQHSGKGKGKGKGRR